MPYVWQHFLIGMVAIHVWFAYFYVTGWLARGNRRADNDAFALADLVISTAAGMALFGFAIFAIGIVGLLNAFGFVLVALVEASAFVFVARRKGLTARGVVADVLRPLRAACTPVTLALYAALVVVAIPAALPAGNFDVMEFYLPTPLGWANAGRIFSDVTLPWPYYVNNFLLLYAAFFRVGLGDFANFLPWLCGALSTLGIYATLRAIALAGTKRTGAAITVGVPLALSVAFVAMPTFLRWVDGGMLDVPIGTFLFVPVLCAVLSRLGDRGSYRWELIVIAAFAVGLKPTLPAFLPLFALLWFASVPAGAWRRGAVPALVLLVVLSSPWYVRNLILDHDPAPPLLHVALRQPDPMFTADDIRNQFNGLRTSRSPAALATLPVRFFFDTLSADFIDYGTNATAFLIYAPFAALGFMFLRRRPSAFHPATVLLTASFVFGCAYWIMTTHHARFFLEIEPIFIAAVGTLIIDLARDRGSVVQGTALAISIAGLVPSPASWGFLNYLYQVQYLGIAAYMPSVQQFDATFCDGCLEADYVAAHLRPGERAYLLDLLQLTYLMRERGIATVGARFSAYPGADLIRATEAGHLAPYLDGLSVGAVLVDAHADWPDDSAQSFRKQIAAAGFRETELDRPRHDGHISIYLRASAER